MQSRRRFLGTMTLPTAAALAGVAVRPTRLRAESLDIALDLARHPGGPLDVVDDEDFWFQVQRAFTVDRTLVNLNNGGVSPAPGLVQEAMKRHQDFSNLAPTYTMWQILEPQREATRERVAGSGAWIATRSRSRATRRRAFRSCNSASTSSAVTRC